MQQDPQEREALKQEIQSAIAAGRELDPEMDPHLADSVLDKYYERKTTAKKTQVSPVRQFNEHPLTPVIMPVLGVGLAVAIFIYAKDYWWLIFVIPAFLSAISFRNSGKYRYRYEKRRRRYYDDDENDTARRSHEL